MLYSAKYQYSFCFRSGQDARGETVQEYRQLQVRSIFPDIINKKHSSFSPEDMNSEAMGYSLDDYIYSLEARGGVRNGQDSEADIQTQLIAKERDLILAAELGKALLEKNEELSVQNEKIAEEFSQKLEVGEEECKCETKVLGFKI